MLLLPHQKRYADAPGMRPLLASPHLACPACLLAVLCSGERPCTRCTSLHIQCTEYKPKPRLGKRQVGQPPPSLPAPFASPSLTLRPLSPPPLPSDLWLQHGPPPVGGPQRPPLLECAASGRRQRALPAKRCRRHRRTAAPALGRARRQHQHIQHQYQQQQGPAALHAPQPPGPPSRRPCSSPGAAPPHHQATSRQQRRGAASCSSSSPPSASHPAAPLRPRHALPRTQPGRDGHQPPPARPPSRARRPCSSSSSAARVPSRRAIHVRDGAGPGPARPHPQQRRPLGHLPAQLPALQPRPLHRLRHRAQHRRPATPDDDDGGAAALPRPRPRAASRPAGAAAAPSTIHGHGALLRPHGQAATPHRQTPTMAAAAGAPSPQRRL